ncbi:uncharacterized protein TNCV_1735551 [Trichonephila clavipes]|nr:uncharacterized protein TNCV_1735551 [Trichonephila clavipes]
MSRKDRAVGSLVVRASDSRPEGLGSMLDATKYPPSAHGFTCRNCGGGDRGRVAIYRPFGEVSLSLNRTVTCMVLKANDRRTSCPCHDEFRGPRSDYVRQWVPAPGRWAAGVMFGVFVPRARLEDMPTAPPLKIRPAGWRGRFVTGLLRLWFRVRPRPKSVGFHDAENRQRPCRMIAWHVKAP